MNTASAIATAALAALAPTLTCLTGIILQRQDTRDLQTEIISLHDSVDQDLRLIDERVSKVETK